MAAAAAWAAAADHRDDALMLPPPALAPTTALLAALLFTLLYLAPFYLSPALRTSPLNSRDAPAVIAARVRAVAFTCVACTLITVFTLAVHAHAGPSQILRLLGLWPVSVLDVAKTLALVAVLFVGPLYESLIVDGDWRGWSGSALKEAVWTRWTGYRNLLVAPASEELVFRALVIALYLCAGVDGARIVFTTPLVFGLAHVHHLVEFLQSYTPGDRKLPPLNVLLVGVARTLIMFTYTSLFGFFAAFLYLRTGNLYAAIAAHMFCNWQGVPRVSGRIGPPSLGIAWTVKYYLLLVVGSFGFYQLLWPLTESSTALIAF